MSWSRAAGALLVLIAAAGFLTVADDLRHVGELLGVGSILLIGLLVFASSFLSSASDRVAVLWLAGAIGLGAAAGGATNHMTAGVVGGLAAGGALAAIFRRRRAREASRATHSR